MSRQPLGQAGSKQYRLGLQAQQLALTGIEEMRVRLDRDYRWRDLGDTQAVSFLEQVLDPVDSSLVGHYRIQLNQKWQEEPYQLLRLESEGMVGSADRPTARYVIKATLDIRPFARPGSDQSVANPDFFQWVDWDEFVP